MKPLEEYNHTQPDRCNMCGADIIWVKSVGGNCLPVDPAPVPDGELIIITGIIQPPLPSLLDLIFGPECRYRQHVRSCTQLSAEDGHRIEKAMATAPHPHPVTNCNCGARMFMAPSAASGGAKKIPMQELPTPIGNIFLNDKHEAVYVSAKNPAPAGATLYMSHFADCKFADQFRTKKG